MQDGERPFSGSRIDHKRPSSFVQFVVHRIPNSRQKGICEVVAVGGNTVGNPQGDESDKSNSDQINTYKADGEHLVNISWMDRPLTFGVLLRPTVPMNPPTQDCYSGFLEAPTTILCDRYAYLPEHGVTLPHSYDPIFPSGLFFASCKSENAIPSAPDLPPPPNHHQLCNITPLEYQDPAFSGGSPSVHQAPFSMDPVDHSVLLDLMFPTADFSHPQRLELSPPQPIIIHYLLPTTNQPSYLDLNYQQPLPARHKLPQSSAPACHGDIPREVTVVDQPPGTFTRNRSHRHACLYLWEGHSGGAFGLGSSLGQVGDHQRRVYCRPE